MAAIHGRFTRSQILIQNGNCDLNRHSAAADQNIFARPLLFLTRSLILCLPTGGEIDCVDKYGNTPLHVAAKYGHELLISTLMTNGADTAR